MTPDQTRPDPTRPDRTPGEPTGSGMGAAQAQRGVVTGGLWRAASTLVPMVSALALTVVISRRLGPEALGLQSLVAYVQALALNTTVLSLTQAGIQVLSAARGAGDESRLAWLTRWSLLAHAAAGAGITAVMLVVGLLRQDPPLLWLVVAATGLVDALAYGSTARVVAARGWTVVSQRRLVTRSPAPPSVSPRSWRAWGSPVRSRGRRSARCTCWSRCCCSSAAFPAAVDPRHRPRGGRCCGSPRGSS